MDQVLQHLLDPSLILVVYQKRLPEDSIAKLPHLQGLRLAEVKRLLEDSIAKLRLAEVAEAQEPPELGLQALAYQRRVFGLDGKLISLDPLHRAGWGQQSLVWILRRPSAKMHSGIQVRRCTVELSRLAIEGIWRNQYV